MHLSLTWKTHCHHHAYSLFLFASVLEIAAVSLTFSPRLRGEPVRPNIIVIMADDLGAEALGSYGSTIYSTPNLDRMAREGARFDNAYATPLCTPTRVMLMTGQYPNRTGFTNLISKDKKARMPETLKTFGTYFKKAGYHNAIAGKWQLGRLDLFSNQPMEHGFDDYCLWKWKYANKKSSRYYSPGIWCNGASTDGSPHEYGPDMYLQFILNFIEKNRNEPFLVYFPMALVHPPLVAPPALKERAYSKYPQGINKKTKIFGHMVTYMDMMVGKIMETVKAAGIEDHTLIIFTGDNGSPNDVKSRLSDHLVVQGGKSNKNEAGTRVPFIARWPGRIPPGVRTSFISLVDVLPTIASIAHIEVDDEVDGMDLSHNLLGTSGKDRQYVVFAYKDDLWVRDNTFRFHRDGSLFYCPVTSNKTRYQSRLSDRAERKHERRRLRGILDNYKVTVPTTDAGIAVRHTKRRRLKKQKPAAYNLKSPKGCRNGSSHRWRQRQ
jgi:arylsulfatase A